MITGGTVLVPPTPPGPPPPPTPPAPPVAPALAAPAAPLGLSGCRAAGAANCAVAAQRQPAHRNGGATGHEQAATQAGSTSGAGAPGSTRRFGILDGQVIDRDRARVGEQAAI